MFVLRICSFRYAPVGLRCIFLLKKLRACSLTGISWIRNSKGLKHDATISSAKKGKGNPGAGGVAENYKEGKIPDPCVVQKRGTLYCYTQLWLRWKQKCLLFPQQTQRYEGRFHSRKPAGMRYDHRRQRIHHEWMRTWIPVGYYPGKHVFRRSIEEKKYGMDILLKHLEDNPDKIRRESLSNDMVYRNLGILRLDVIEIQGKWGR